MFAPRLLAFVSLAAFAYAAISQEEFATKSSQGLRLISIEEGVDPVWLSEEEKLGLIRQGERFFDVTETYDAADRNFNTNARVAAAAYTYTPVTTPKPAVTSLFGSVSLTQSQSWMTTLTAYNNRYYKSTTGAAASTWIKDQLQAIATAYPTSGATVAQFTHSAFTQKSVIATIPGSNSSKPRIVLGGHLDSINQSNPTSGRAPGADDDGSSVINLMEAFRVLVTSGFQPSSTLEFHFYAGEEGGLLGSQAIAKSYKTAGVAVKAMINLDMTAYFKVGTTEVITLIPDYVDAGLTSFVGSVISTYLTIPWITGDACNYACSDHASWYNQGYPAAYPFEALDVNMNPRIHTTGDTTSLSGFSWSHLTQFTKLAIATAYELAL